jgi:hypothetical protein
MSHQPLDAGFRWLANATALSIWALSCACSAPSDASSNSRALPQYSVAIEEVMPLDVGEMAILASARSLSRDSNGRLYIADRSDRRIKVFGSDGRQQRPIGAPGGGPGEFTTLLSAGILSDSAFGWDATLNRLTFFSPGGEEVRSIALGQPGSPVWARVRPMDDSLLVASGWVMSAYDRPLVEVYDRRGGGVGKMMKLSRLLSPPAPELLQHTWVFADGHDNVVFSTLHGVDTIFAYTPTGRLLGSGRLELAGFSPVLDLRQLLSRGGGRLRDPNGTWMQDGHYAALALVTFGKGLAAVQFGRLTLAEGGTDLLSTGGPIVVLQLSSDGVIRKVAQVDAPGALLGRGNVDEAYVLQWSGSDLTKLTLFRLYVQETSP